MVTEKWFRMDKQDRESWLRSMSLDETLARFRSFSALRYHVDQLTYADLAQNIIDYAR